MTPALQTLLQKIKPEKGYRYERNFTNDEISALSGEEKYQRKILRYTG